ncbi:hypothetical protein AAC387_Pa05g1295 [Persea americana]
MSSWNISGTMMEKILAALFMGLIAWAYRAIQPPPPKICGSPNGPPVTAPRIKLRDGRHLAYKEHGVPKDKAKHKIVSVHGFDSCRHDAFPLSSELAEELGIYLVSYDRAGYGESDPHPKRTVKSAAMDIEELADQLELGSKFYVIGISLGGQTVWSCLRYIPHRLRAAALIAPAINYWWSGLPANLSSEAFKKQLAADQWAARVAHYAPWLVYWWNTQKWFPSSNVISNFMDVMSPQDKVFLPKLGRVKPHKTYTRQQGEFESVHHDMIMAFTDWGFSPMDLENPFINKEGYVHLWHGDDDRIVPVEIQRYIAAKLPWIQYHEVPSAGHRFLFENGYSNAIVKALLLGEK